MNRRTFLQSLGVVGAATLASGAEGETAAIDESESKYGADASGGTNAWLFWDLWHVSRRQNLELCQGQATWVPEAVYTDHVDGLASWPTVVRDEATGRWRMLYTARWSPYSLMVAESDDGLHFRPLPQPAIEPEGEKLAPNHLFTLPSGSCGGVDFDPVAAGASATPGYTPCAASSTSSTPRTTSS